MAEIIRIEPWQRLASRLSVEAQGLSVESGTLREKITALLQRLSRSSDLAAAARSAQELDPRYQPRQGDDSESFAFLGRVDAGVAVAAFIGRSGLAASALSGADITGDALRAAFLEASRPTESSVVTLVVLDGLDLEGDAPVYTEGGPRLRRLDSRFLDEFFAGDIPGEITLSQLTGLVALEFRELATNPPWSPTVFDLGTFAQRVRSKAWPWAAYVNLFCGSGFVQPVAVYRKAHSHICSPAVRAAVADQPVWQPRFMQVADDEWEEFEEPFISVRADAAKLCAFIHEMEAARQKASAKGHRADTALRLFVRYAESTRQWSDFHATDDEDVIDRSIVDGATLMEAISLNPNQMYKGKEMALRLSSFLAASPNDQEALAAKIKHAYGIRSDLVHADKRPDSDVLNSVAALFLRLSRPALVAFLRAGGDVQEVVRCATDSAHAAYMRSLAALPDE